MYPKKLSPIFLLVVRNGIYGSGEEWHLRDKLYPKLKKEALQKIRKLCRDAILE